MSATNASNAPDGAASPATETPATGSPPKSDGVEGRIDYKEVVGLRKETRETISKVDALAASVAQLIQKLGASGTESSTTTVTSTPATGADDAVKQVTALMEFKDHLTELGVTSTKQRTALTNLWKAEKPSDVGPWLKETTEALGLKLGTQDKPPITTPSNQGTPKLPGNSNGAPDSVLTMTETEISNLTPAQIMESLNKATGKSRGSNPYQNIKRAHEK